MYLSYWNFFYLVQNSLLLFPRMIFHWNPISLPILFHRRNYFTVKDVNSSPKLSGYYNNFRLLQYK